MLTCKDRKFYLDGKEFQILSGALHYFRTLPEYWEDIMRKFKAMGLNTVETYCCWNYHEPKKGEFDFTGRFDLESFIETADRVGLKVIIRPGPYICAEWENGGLPAWLLKDRNTVMRCVDEPYITHFKEYMNVLLDKIKPHLHTLGGPVIAVALENEYGSYGDDFEYLDMIEELYKNKEMNVFLFVADGASDYYNCTGSRPHIFKGGDYEIGVWKPGFMDVMDNYQDRKDNPRFTAEYWGGTFTWWGDESIKSVDKKQLKKDIEGMFSNGESFNIYMGFGGTNFGFTSGANLIKSIDEKGFEKETYNPVITSYDYDAPISEWGGYNDSFWYLREILTDGKSEVPPQPCLQDIGEVTLTQSANIFDNLHIGTKHFSKTVQHMEYYNQNNGFILYKKVMEYDSPYNQMIISGLSDRAHIFINGELVGIRCRTNTPEEILNLPKELKKGDVIEIFVENMGRIGFGYMTYRGDRKGITDMIRFGCKPLITKILFDWEITTLEMDDISNINYQNTTDIKCPAFFKGEFSASSNDSCFVHFDNFKKGIIYINGFNLGRYWEKGPQEELYLPGVILKDKNEIIVFETDGLNGAPVISINSKYKCKEIAKHEFVDGKDSAVAK